MRFKDFLVNENKYYLGTKAGDLLTALQELGDDASNLGNRALIRATQGIINQIRKILHGRWDEEDVRYLKTLQKIGVALCKAIDEKGDDMAMIISSAGQELEKMLSDMEVPINSVAKEEEYEEETPPIAPGSQFEA